MGQVGVIIAAGGIGSRMGTDCPKQFLQLREKPVIIYTLQKFNICDSIHEIVIVVPPDDIERSQKLVDRWQIQKVSQIVAGGKERQNSVENGLNALSDQTDIVLVHDAVRPFVPIQKIIDIIDAVRQYGTAILAVPEKCTIKEIDNGWIQKTVDRTNLWQAQTPQGVQKELLIKAFQSLKDKPIQVTDTVSLIERMGHPVKLVHGDPKNIKITTPEDLIFAEAIAKWEETCA